MAMTTCISKHLTLIIINRDVSERNDKNDGESRYKKEGSLVNMGRTLDESEFCNYVIILDTKWY